MDDAVLVRRLSAVGDLAAISHTRASGSGASRRRAITCASVGPSTSSMTSAGAPPTVEAVELGDVRMIQ